MFERNFADFGPPGTFRELQEPAIAFPDEREDLRRQEMELAREIRDIRKEILTIERYETIEERAGSTFGALYFSWFSWFICWSSLGCIPCFL